MKFEGLFSATSKPPIQRHFAGIQNLLPSWCGRSSKIRSHVVGLQDLSSFGGSSRFITLWWVFKICHLCKIPNYLERGRLRRGYHKEMTYPYKATKKWPILRWLRRDDLPWGNHEEIADPNKTTKKWPPHVRHWQRRDDLPWANHEEMTYPTKTRMKWHILQWLRRDDLP